MEPEDAEPPPAFIRLIGGELIGRSKLLLPVAASAGAMVSLVALVGVEAGIVVSSGRGFFPFAAMLPVYEAAMAVGAVWGFYEGLGYVRPRKAARASPPPRAAPGSRPS